MSRSGTAALDGLRGILLALRADIERDVLALQSRVSADIFSDFLQQAENLLDGKYTIPSGVLAGATLEEHLRKLAQRHSISLTDPNNGKPRRAAALNADLKQAKVYSNTEHAQVDAWQKIRNDAAHGDPNFPRIIFHAI